MLIDNIKWVTSIRNAIYYLCNAGEVSVHNTARGIA